MIIFIDESGIHKQIDHSTFALVHISFENKEMAEARLKEIETNLRIESFHWTEHSWKVREKFFKSVVSLPFEVKIAIFRNPVSPAKALSWSLQHVLVEKHFRGIYIDGKKPRWVEYQIKKALRDKGVSVAKLKTVRYQGSFCMHLADAFAGLSRAYYDNPEEKAKNLWKIASKKITAQLLGGQTDG